MSEVRIRYHHEPEGWWADSPDLPGFSAAGETFDEVREMALEGVSFVTDTSLRSSRRTLRAGIPADTRLRPKRFDPRLT